MNARERINAVVHHQLPLESAFRTNPSRSPIFAPNSSVCICFYRSLLMFILETVSSLVTFVFLLHTLYA